MVKKPITIGAHYFSKKGDAEQFLKDILKRYEVGDKVSKDDEVVLRAALALHPEAVAKVGCGVSDFSVRSAEFNTKCFWINRSDGSTEKFAVRACVYG